MRERGAEDVKRFIATVNESINLCRNCAAQRTLTFDPPPKAAADFLLRKGTGDLSRIRSVMASKDANVLFC